MPPSLRTSLFALPLVALAACGEPPPAVTPPAPSAPPAASTAAPAPVAAPPAAGLAYPATAKRPVVNEYHGVKVTDDYQWLEKSDDPEVQAWMKEQTKLTRGVLDAIPAAAPLRERIGGLLRGQSSDYAYFIKQGNVQFAWKFEPPKEQPILVTLPSIDDPGSARVVLDPNVLDKAGKTTMDFYVPSLDGKKVAVSLSKGGSEAGDVHIYDTATGKELPDVLEHVNGGTAGGSVAWNKDGTGLFYTRYPHAGERAAEDMAFFQQVYFHKLGTPPGSDTYAIGKEFPRIAEIALSTSDDGKYILANVANGDGGEFEHWLFDGKAWKQLTHLEDKITEMMFGRDGKLYLLSQKGAPKGKIQRITVQKPDLAKAETLVPESEGTIRSMTITASKLYVVDLLGGPSQIRLFDLQGKAQPGVPIPPISSVGQIARLGGEDVLIRVTSYLQPGAWHRFAGKGEVTKSKLFTTSPADFSGIEAVREMCVSKDGTKVPLNILRKKGLTLDHAAPTLLYGYGGYNVSLSPGFNPTTLAWLEQGGVYAIANLRGGGEFGEAWHDAGRLTKKQNVFDDFAACAEHLATAGYTRPDRLVIQGGSNGGLLMGAMITQHPELFRAAHSAVGIYDMLRSELWPNGAFNIPEFGTVKDPEQFKAMVAYSPYHHVKDGTAYPAVLFTTGLNDPRVDPGQSRKMAARLQAAGSKNPILLLVKANAGHGVGGSLSEEINNKADAYAFFFKELGIEYKPVAAK
jgi:prolyl oligopeptidase